MAPHYYDDDDHHIDRLRRELQELKDQQQQQIDTDDTWTIQDVLKYFSPTFYLQLVSAATAKTLKYVILPGVVFLVAVLICQPTLIFQLLATFFSLFALFWRIVKITLTTASTSLAVVNCCINPRQCSRNIWSSWSPANTFEFKNILGRSAESPSTVLTSMKPTLTNSHSSRSTVTSSRPTYTAGGIPYWNFSQAEEGYALWTNSINQELGNSFKITNPRQHHFASESEPSGHQNHPKWSKPQNDAHAQSKDLILPLSALIESSVALTSAISYIDRRADISLRDDVVKDIMPRLSKMNTLTLTMHKQYKAYNKKWLKLVDSMVKDSFEASQNTSTLADEFQATIDQAMDEEGSLSSSTSSPSLSSSPSNRLHVAPIFLNKGNRSFFNPMRFFKGSQIFERETLVEQAHRIYLRLLIERRGHIHRISVIAREIYQDSQKLLHLIESINININYLTIQINKSEKIKSNTKDALKRAIDEAEAQRLKERRLLFFTRPQTFQEQEEKLTREEKIHLLITDIAQLGTLSDHCMELQAMLERDDGIWHRVFAASDEFLSGTRPWSEFEGWLADIEKHEDKKGLSIFGFWSEIGNGGKLDDDHKKLQQANHFVEEVRWWARSRTEFARELEEMIENMLASVEGKSSMAADGIKEARMNGGMEG
ncbi:hypothetical protein EAF00_012023 [Botryotinia globosa]|nr:hypothetical protein EAF00_012023 [Botryotinia globosa]